MRTRRSRLAYVVIRLRVDGRDSYLLRAHGKWGDWSLVGGHVEPDELGDWSATARREAEEELAPLRYGTDFDLVPIPNAPKQWGPVNSRSAGGVSTVYEAVWFALVFLQDPIACLELLPESEFMLVEEQIALQDPSDANVAPLLARLHETLPGGLQSVPRAWPRSIEEVRVSTPVRHVAVRSL